jgi:hypothetical protein
MTIPIWRLKKKGVGIQGAHRRTADVRGHERIQADERAGRGTHEATSASAPELTGSEGNTFAHRPFHSIAPASAPSAALLG